MKKHALFLLPTACAIILSSCGGGFGPPNLGGPTVAERQSKIDNEPKGDFYYGRRYYVQKTRFWGYLRKPGQPASSSKLVVFNESKKHNPDRLPEVSPIGELYGYDQNYEYKIYGHYTGEKVYEVNSNQFLPEFMLTGYKLLEKNPGWLFDPKDHYNPKSITMLPH